MGKAYTRAEIEALLPKTSWHEDGDSVVACDNPQTKFDIEYIANDLDKADARFIAAAPAIIRQLLSQLEEAEKIEAILKSLSPEGEIEIQIRGAFFNVNGLDNEYAVGAYDINEDWVVRYKGPSLRSALESLTKG